MKALVFTGIKEPLVYKDITVPEVEDDSAIVTLKAAGINRRDYWITYGLYPGIVFPTVLGSDGCGIYEGREVVICPNVNWGNDQRFPQEAYDIIGLKNMALLQSR